MASYGDKDKKELIAEYQLHENDKGSVQLQVALLTTRINHLVEYLKNNKKDSHTRAGLLNLVGKRRRFISYLQKKDPEGLSKLSKKLKLKIK